MASFLHYNVGAGCRAVQVLANNICCLRGACSGKNHEVPAVKRYQAAEHPIPKPHGMVTKEAGADHENKLGERCDRNSNDFSKPGVEERQNFFPLAAVTTWVLGHAPVKAKRLFWHQAWS